MTDEHVSTGRSACREVVFSNVASKRLVQGSPTPWEVEVDVDNNGETFGECIAGTHCYMIIRISRYARSCPSVSSSTEACNVSLLLTRAFCRKVMSIAASILESSLSSPSLAFPPRPPGCVSRLCHLACLMICSLRCRPRRWIRE